MKISLGRPILSSWPDILSKYINFVCAEHSLNPHSRQMLAQQPNRIFIKCLLLSEARIRLAHFDRAGAEVAPYIDYVNNPELFVRLIITLCSVDEKELGFDTSIQWDIVKGKKVSGTMKTCDLNQQEKTYELANIRPVAQEYDIRGRGTTIWEVLDPDTKDRYLVKQSWTSEGRPHEHLHLLRAQRLKIPGVCRIVGYEVLEETQQFRCANTAFSNRVGLRIVIPIYGKQVDKFKSVLQALRAIRDAVAGEYIPHTLSLFIPLTYYCDAAHEGLWKGKILHRDITNKNILLGNEGAGKGWYGVLIDLGVALDFGDEASSNITKEARSVCPFL